MFFDSQLVIRQINECRRRAQAIVSGLSPQQLCTRPQPGKWSIAECLAHLNISASALQRMMIRAIERGRQEKKFGRGRFAIGLRGRLMIWVVEPPPKFRIPAPRALRPPGRFEDSLQLLPAFLKAQDEWERLMREQEGLHLARIKFGSPTSRFHARLAAALPFGLAHQLRHLAQAENVKQQLYAACQVPVAHPA
jgi:DinB family protein